MPLRFALAFSIPGCLIALFRKFPIFYLWRKCYEIPEIRPNLRATTAKYPQNVGVWITARSAHIELHIPLPTPCGKYVFFFLSNAPGCRFGFVAFCGRLLKSVAADHSFSLDAPPTLSGCAYRNRCWDLEAKGTSVNDVRGRCLVYAVRSRSVAQCPGSTAPIERRHIRKAFVAGNVGGRHTGRSPFCIDGHDA